MCWLRPYRGSGWFATVLLGVPVVLAALPVGMDGRRPCLGGGIDWLAAILAMAWAVLLALGVGLAFIPAALLQLAAAATAMRLAGPHESKRNRTWGPEVSCGDKVSGRRRNKFPPWVRLQNFQRLEAVD